MKTVIVVSYDEQWPNEFIKIKNELASVLDDAAISIEHVGSTSVPGLCAKPVIDIDVVIDQMRFDDVKARLATIGYEHVGDQGVPGREAFKYENKTHLLKHHLYVCDKDAEELKRHLALRDFLRKNEVYRKKYSDIKTLMAQRHPHDIDAYIDGKEPVVMEIYAQCGLDISYKANVNPRLKAYIRQHIFPQYNDFDAAHKEEHVRRVINNSFLIAQNFDVNLQMIYTIAAYHDIGLIHGREHHERTSAQILLADETIKSWFAHDELLVMAEAIADHRASGTHEPRSIYGKIIAEADRDLEYLIILKRCILFSQEHYPHYTTEQHFERLYHHMQDKYGVHGYLNIWLDTEPNRSNLALIREKLANPSELKSDFLHTFQETQLT